MSASIAFVDNRLCELYRGCSGQLTKTGPFWGYLCAAQCASDGLLRPVQQNSASLCKNKELGVIFDILIIDDSLCKGAM